MSLLRSLEEKIEGLVEGAFSRAFKSHVQPVELARKLAKEMEEHKTVSVSRVYVPDHYVVFLSPDDREQFSTYEVALKKELSDYLLERARDEGLALVTRPQIEFKTDDRLALGEFGIQAQLLGQPEGDAEPPPADYGHTMVYTPERAAAPLRDDTGHARGRGLLVFDGKRTVLAGERTTIGRSRECDVVVDDPNVSRKHAEVRRTIEGWMVVDLGSTNGIKVNGRRVNEAVLSAGDEITLGLVQLAFEEE
ncbi:MAG: FhaA domain-containing protein [Thermoleophilaceae bacterium]